MSDPAASAATPDGETQSQPLRVSVAKVVYTTCYFTSYMAVFPTLWAASLVPRDSAAGRGFRAGSHSARELVASMTARRAPGGHQRPSA